MIRDAVRRFVEAEVVPRIEELEHGELPPYEILRKLISTFGMDEMARARFQRQKEKETAAEAHGGADRKRPQGARSEPQASEAEESDAGGRGDSVALQLIPIIELCRYCPGLVTAMGVSMGLTAGAILAKGTPRQKERWALPLLTFEKIGAWAITEPGSGSDAFGSMKSTARRDGQGGYVLNGSKTFITNGPWADILVFICKLDEPEVPPAARRVLTFVVEKGTPGLEQSKPMRKMGLHSSPTGEIFLRDVRVGPEHLLGENEQARESKSGARATFSIERSGVTAMALGIVERCLELSLRYARERVQFGRPIGEFQLIQDKLARMEVARMNLQNLVFRTIELAGAGRSPTLAEASAMKLYAARAAMEVALEAVQVHGGNGYMAEYHVEQLCRDAKVLQIYAGTDEIQISAIARDLLSR
jgi:alkylation response protein AidB-like acyl-CoA dehydrogenase